MPGNRSSKRRRQEEEESPPPIFHPKRLSLPIYTSSAAAAVGNSKKKDKCASLERLFCCCRDRFLPPDKSSLFFLQAMLVWCALCLPGNVVTLVMYRRVANAAADAAAAIRAANTTDELQLQDWTNTTIIGNLTNYGHNDSDVGDLDLSKLLSLYCHPSSVSVENLRERLSRCITDRRQCSSSNNSSEKCFGQLRRELEKSPNSVLEGKGCMLTQQQQQMETMSASQLLVCLLEMDKEEAVTTATTVTVATAAGRRTKDKTAAAAATAATTTVVAETTTTNATSTMKEEEEEEDMSSDYQCHERISDYQHFMTSAQFWLENVSLLVVGVVGMAGNVMTIIVLGRIDSNTTFNRLLMSLAMVDTLLLFYYVLDYGFVGTFVRSASSEEPEWYRLSFPYLHPFKYFCLSASIFMVVAISAERHRAICSPLTHRPAFWPYAFMVLCVSGASNIPKFLEFELHTDESNFTDYWTTPLNEDPAYITFSSWWDELIVTGVIPLAALVLFNSRIYLKLRASDKQKYRFVGRRRLNNTPSDQQSIYLRREDTTSCNRVRQMQQQHQRGLQQQQQPHPLHQQQQQQQQQQQTEFFSQYSPEIRREANLSFLLRQHRQNTRSSTDTDSFCETTLTCFSDGHQPQPPVNGSRNGGTLLLLKEQRRVAGSEEEEVENGQVGVSVVQRKSSQEEEEYEEEEFKDFFRFKSFKRQQQQQQLCSQAQLVSGSPGKVLVHLDSLPLPTQSSSSAAVTPSNSLARTRQMSSSLQLQQQHQEGQTTSQHFRKRREKSAMILVSIVLTFLFCQTFRLVIQAYEVTHPSHSTPNLYEHCMARGRYHVPVAFLVMLSASNLFLVINSSINFLIYCCVGKSFRAELKTIVSALCTVCRKLY